MKNAGENFSSSLHRIGPMSVCNFSKSFALLPLEHNRRKKSHNSIIASTICFGNPHRELLLEATAALVRDSHDSLVPQSYLN